MRLTDPMTGTSIRNDFIRMIDMLNDLETRIKALEEMLLPTLNIVDETTYDPLGPTRS